MKSTMESADKKTDKKNPVSPVQKKQPHTNNQMIDDNEIDSGAGKILHTGVDMRDDVPPEKESTKSEIDQDTSELFYPNRHGKNQHRISPDH